MSNHHAPLRKPILSEDMHIDYKELRLLRRCITENGKIMPARMTGFSRSQQRLLKKAAENARYLSLISYLVE